MRMIEQHGWKAVDAALPPLHMWRDLPFQMLVDAMCTHATMGGGS